MHSGTIPLMLSSSLIRFLISVLLMLSSGVSTMVTPFGTLPMLAPWRG